jgi:hypothetical protein
MIFSVYKFTNTINGKVYIGKTKNNPNGRKEDHFRNAFIHNGQTVFYQGLRKYGKEVFLFEIINQKAKDIEELNDLERFYIKEYDCCFLDGVEKGYNMTRGGDGIDSDLAKIIAQQRLKDGKNPFAGEAGSKRAKDRVLAGTNPFAGALGTAMNMKRIADGTHNFLGEEADKRRRAMNKKKIAEGTHPFAGELGSIMSKAVQAKRIQDGTHHLIGENGKKFVKTLMDAGRHSCQKVHTCPHCNKTGKGPGMFTSHMNNCKKRILDV